MSDVGTTWRISLTRHEEGDVVASDRKWGATFFLNEDEGEEQLRALSTWCLNAIVGDVVRDTQ